MSSRGFVTHLPVVGDALRTPVLFTGVMVGLRRSGRTTAKAATPPPELPPPATESTEFTVVQRPKRTRAGQGGHAAQLERAGEAVTKKKPPKRQVVLPDDEPVNVIAPTPRQPRKRASRSTKPNAGTGLQSAAPADTRLLPQQAAPAGRFGFQLGPPPPPTYVGSQSVNDFEQEQLTGNTRTSGGGDSFSRDADPGRGQLATAPPSQSHVSIPSGVRQHASGTLRGQQPHAHVSIPSSARQPTSDTLRGQQSHTHPVPRARQTSQVPPPAQSLPPPVRSQSNAQLSTICSKPTSSHTLHQSTRSQVIRTPIIPEVERASSPLSETSSEHREDDSFDERKEDYDLEKRGRDEYMDQCRMDDFVDEDRNIDQDRDIDDEDRRDDSVDEHRADDHVDERREDDYMDERRDIDFLNERGEEDYVDVRKDEAFFGEHEEVDFEDDNNPFSDHLDHHQAHNSTPHRQRSQAHRARNSADSMEVDDVANDRHKQASVRSDNDDGHDGSSDESFAQLLRPPPRKQPPSQLTRGRSRPVNQPAGSRDRVPPSAPHRAPSTQTSQTRPSTTVPRSNSPPPVSPSMSRAHPGEDASDERQTRRSNHPNDAMVNANYDVLEQHHAINRRRRSPSPSYLDNIDRGSTNTHPPSKRVCSIQLSGRNANVDDAVSTKSRHGKYSKNPKGSQAAKPTTMAFYPPLWSKLLTDSKSRMRLLVIIGIGTQFLDINTALDNECMEILFEMIAFFEANGLEVEIGYFPLHKRDMARVVFNDIGTFRSELKKVAMQMVRAYYDLSPPSTAASQEERIKAVKDKATKLLFKGQYLRGARDALGKTSNFAHEGLKQMCLAAFYNRTSGKSLRQFPEFQKQVPSQAVAYMASMAYIVILSYQTNGFDAGEPLDVEVLEPSYNRLASQMNRIFEDKYHGPKLEKTLEDWAQIGMLGYTPKTREMVDDSDDEFAIDLD
ncbi:hypothetical protein BJ138DRAFT_1119571 [Hygrophoropsis aurantiaca]|uniref:Uncharacterized protein n=1 Tax=Hygrophoropsis aurantiaca TaxID=72124 RepID=A0ACB7ZUB1_9AGAM|nr:hypothetical protein BJ138DRAFT_1119571 [Hygrophoropsis aurantiaca]